MKRIVITGSSKGIGYGMATCFLEKGHKVVIVGSSEQSTNNALERLQVKYSNKVYGVSCNVINYDEVSRLSEKAIELMGGYDIWINNAGVTQRTASLIDLSQDEIKNVIDININGVINGSQVAMKHFTKQGSGAIYNMEGLGSDGRLAVNIGYYGGSKRFVRYFTRVLAKENTSKRIIVGRLSPGMVTTDLLMKDLNKSKNKEKTLKIFSILADKVEVVTPFLVDGVLKNAKNGQLIAWLTTPKIMYRFMTSGIIKRNPFD